MWVAEQLRPVKRRVAIKLIKAGMDSKQVLARFEAERQALAVMDHPNIAKVYDGAMTDQGRPFFVMEFPIPQPPARRFHTLHDASAWIAHNWPDFDLEAAHPVTWHQ